MSARRPHNALFRATEVAILVVCAVVACGVLFYLGNARPAFDREAIVRAGVGQDLLDGLGRGRQGLVGSLYYAPLPTLLALPLFGLPPAAEWGFVVVSIMAGAATVLLLAIWLRHCRLNGWIRFGIAFAVFASPLMLRQMLSGRSEPLFAFFALAVACFFMHWWRTDQLRSLGYLAVALGLALATRYQALLLALPVTFFVLVHLIERRHSESYAEATLIVFLTPALYVAGLWAMANWLIMGDPLFFLRGLWNTTGREQHLLKLASDGLDWRPVLLVIGIALLGRLSASLSTRPRRRFAGLLVLIASLFIWSPAGLMLQEPMPPEELELQRVLHEFNESWGGDWLVAAGYRGYDIRRRPAVPEPPFLHHTLDFHPGGMLKDTRGKRTYLLVPLPEGADRWEEINLAYPDIAHHAAPFTVYERTWKYWRLWRVVRQDETDRR